jgi:ubiquitin-protein ligase
LFYPNVQLASVVENPSACGLVPYATAGGAMADTVYQAVVAAHAAHPVCRTFPTLERVSDPNTPADPALVVTARLCANDGGRFLLKLCGEAGSINMVLVVSDGGLPSGFIDDLNPVCFDLDFTTALEESLRTLLTKAAALHIKLNRNTPQPETTSAAESNSTERSDSGSGSVGDHGGVDVAALDATARERPRRSAGPIVVDYKPPVFAPSHLASATLTKQLQLLEGMDTTSMGFSIRPHDDNLYIWRAELYFTDMSFALARDLAEHPTQKHVELEFRFPVDYPYTPPFCRVVAPAFRDGTGHVQSRGGLCMELLTGSGWTPANSMDVVCIQIQSFLVAGNGRLDISHP